MTGDSGQRATSVSSFFRNVNENIVCNDMQIEKIIQIDKHLLLRFFFVFDAAFFADPNRNTNPSLN